MLHEHDRLRVADLVRAGLRRSRGRAVAAVAVALLAAGALFGTVTLLTGMGRNLATNLSQLGADMILVPKGQAEAVRPLLSGNDASPVPATVDVADWRERIKQARIVGIINIDAISLEQGGKGEPTGGKASAALVYLESWASPLLAHQDIAKAIPEADVLVGEQATREVARNLAPVVRLLTAAAGVALLGAVLMSGLLTSIRVAERRSELGMLRAVGATRSALINLTLWESGLPALGGAVAGVALAGLVLIAQNFARDALAALTGTEIVLAGLGAVLLTLAVTILSALGPAVRAASLDPLEAVRRGR